MSSATSAPEALRTMRQRGSVTLGVFAVVVGFGLGLWSLFSGELSLVFIGFMLLVAAGGWVLFWSPALVITHRGVHVQNPLRRTVVPWRQVDDVATRWNLEIYHGEQRTTAWAIAAHVQRPTGAGAFGLMGGLGRKLMAAGDGAPPPSRGVTVGSAADSVLLAKSEWEEMVAEGHPAVSADGELARTWVWLDAAALGVPVLMIVLGLLL